MMKYFLVCLAIFAVSLADDEWLPKTREQMKIIRAECLQEHPLTEGQMKNLRNLEPPDELVVRQYFQCTATKSGVFNPNEGYHAERLAKQFKMDLTEEEARQIAQGCADKNEQNSPIDEWAFRGHRCMMSSKIGDKLKAFIKANREEELKTNALAS